MAPNLTAPMPTEWTGTGTDNKVWRILDQFRSIFTSNPFRYIVRVADMNLHSVNLIKKVAKREDDVDHEEFADASDTSINTEAHNLLKER